MAPDENRATPALAWPPDALLRLRNLLGTPSTRAELLRAMRERPAPAADPRVQPPLGPEEKSPE